MPNYKKSHSEEVEEESRRKKPSRQEEGRVMEAPGGETLRPGPVAQDPTSLLTSPQTAHPANAPLRAQAVTELQRHRGNIHVQQIMERIRTEKGAGRPLETETRAEMELAFGRDFGEVRLHSDTQADKLAGELGAQAFTLGKDIFLREGAYQAGSEATKDLLGHELTHVVQQSQESVVSPSRITNASEAAEVEAQAVAQALTNDRKVSVAPRPETAGAVARRVPGERTPLEAVRASIGGAGAEPPELAGPPHLVVIWNRLVVAQLRQAYEAVNAPQPDYDKASQICYTLRGETMGAVIETARGLGVPEANLKAMSAVHNQTYTLVNMIQSGKQGAKYVAGVVDAVIGNATAEGIFGVSPAIGPI